MPNDRIPRISCHKATGQAVGRLNGKDYHLGRFRSAASHAAYERLIAKWLANGRRLPDNRLLSIQRPTLLWLHGRVPVDSYSPGGTD
jgi:hypothetical protein